jgi:hypothetical protein
VTGRPDNVTPLEPWLSKKQLAAHLGCGVRWLEYQCAAGLPHTIIAGRVKFKASIVEPWLEARGLLQHRGEAA